MKKELGYIGLGKMGANMCERLLDRGYRAIVFDRDQTAAEKLSIKGATPAKTLSELVEQIEAPRVLWIMTPHAAVDAVLAELVPLLSEGDLVIDGGNSPYRESIRRHGELAAKKIGFLDVGVSGGPEGAKNGACVMVGGDKTLFDSHKELFEAISADAAFSYLGGAGAGHFAKMVHNGIEYGMMQAIAEGFAVLKKSEIGISVEEAARIYGKKSVIESRLIDWLAKAYKDYGEELSDVSGTVAATGEGAWTVEAAKFLGVPTPVISASVEFREGSKSSPSYEGKILSALRNEFGGHAVK